MSSSTHFPALYGILATLQYVSDCFHISRYVTCVPNASIPINYSFVRCNYFPDGWPVSTLMNYPPTHNSFRIIWKFKRQISTTHDRLIWSASSTIRGLSGLTWRRYSTQWVAWISLGGVLPFSNSRSKCFNSPYQSYKLAKSDTAYTLRLFSLTIQWIWWLIDGTYPSLSCRPGSREYFRRGAPFGSP